MQTGPLSNPSLHQSGERADPECRQNPADDNMSPEVEEKSQASYTFPPPEPRSRRRGSGKPSFVFEGSRARSPHRLWSMLLFRGAIRGSRTEQPLLTALQLCDLFFEQAPNAMFGEV